MSFDNTAPEAIGLSGYSFSNTAPPRVEAYIEARIAVTGNAAVAALMNLGLGYDGQDPEVLEAGDVVLVYGAPDPADNGVWLVTDDNGLVLRHPIADTVARLRAGVLVKVTAGTSEDAFFAISTARDSISLTAGAEALDFSNVTASVSATPNVLNASRLAAFTADAPEAKTVS